MLSLLAATAWAEPHRWALAVGENRGLGEDPPLRYAQSDARHVLQVLEEVGDVEPSRALLVAGGDASAVRAALGQLQQRLESEGQSDDVVVLYISSHADDGALHLDGTQLPLAELMDALKRLPVFLKARVPTANTDRIDHAVAVLNAIRVLRDSGQHVEALAESAGQLPVLGLAFPITDWSGSWNTITTAAIEAFDTLRDELNVLGEDTEA